MIEIGWKNVDKEILEMIVLFKPFIIIIENSLYSLGIISNPYKLVNEF